jgi:uncharacterized membrane protein
MAIWLNFHKSENFTKQVRSKQPVSNNRLLFSGQWDLKKTIKMNSDLSKAVDYALTHGLVVRHPTDISAVIHAPFSLNPSPFPRSLFQTALHLQPLFNTLVHHLSLSESFLTTTILPYISL